MSELLPPDGATDPEADRAEDEPDPAVLAFVNELADLCAQLYWEGLLNDLDDTAPTR